jgi:transposase
MHVVYERCCGLDVHKRRVVACAVTPEGRETRSFGTMTRELLALAEWLEQRQVTHVAMESTGVYWKPVYNLLEDAFTVLVVNARHIKAVPGRKTDMKDADWIAELLRHGLVQGSFIPDRPQRELRELVRYRRSLVQQRSQVVNRIQKVLEGANIKLGNVTGSIVGVSGRAMLEAMVRGTEDPKALAALARGRLQEKRAALEEALRGLVGCHQRLLLASHLRHLDFLNEEVAHLDEEVAARLSPFQQTLEQLDEVPGVGQHSAEEIVAEIGLNMGRFPSAAHLASWAKLCPGNNESGGTRKSAPAGHGNKWLRTTLVEAARAAARTKDTYLAAQYHRLAARRGRNRAAVAVAHTIITIVYCMLRDGTHYQDLGPTYFDQRDRQAVVRRSIRRLERLGYTVTLEAA